MATQAVLVDTGPLVAILDADDAYHEVCKTEFSKLQGPLFTCWPVITEAAWLLRAFPSRVRTLLEGCQGDPYVILSLTASDVPCINAILTKYEDQRFQLADASLMYLTQRENIQTVFTVDESDFAVFRGKTGDPLNLLPDNA